MAINTLRAIRLLLEGCVLPWPAGDSILTVIQRIPAFQNEASRRGQMEVMETAGRTDSFRIKNLYGGGYYKAGSRKKTRNFQ